jgi:ABC-type amino acid transport substrate-binding protein
MSVVIKSLLLLFFIFGFAQSNSLNNLTIYTENYPPYNMVVQGNKKGISIDLLELLLKNLGSSLTRNDFKFQPWARAYHLTQNNKNTLLFSTTRTPERENSFKWVGPIHKVQIGLIGKRNSNYNIDAFNDLSQYKIGSVLNDVAEQLLYTKGFKQNSIDSLTGTNVVDRSLKKLKYNRIDLFAYNLDVACYNIQLDGEHSKDYKMVYVLDEPELYFAFNKQTDDKLVALFQEELNRIKNTDAYQNILWRYLNYETIKNKYAQ